MQAEGEVVVVLVGVGALGNLGNVVFVRGVTSVSGGREMGVGDAVSVKFEMRMLSGQVGVVVGIVRLENA